MTKGTGLAINFETFFDDLVLDLQTEFANDTAVTNIVDFVEKEISPDWGIKLDVRQMLILKIFYGYYEFSEAEIQIIKAWYELDRTTFDLLFSKDNDIGKKQALIVECGRRGGKCHSLYSLLGSQQYGMVYGHELFKEAMSVSQNLNMLTLEEGMQQLKDVSLPLSHTVAVEGTSRTAQAENFYVKGESPTKKVTTACAYNLEATAEHRIKVLDSSGSIGWRYFRDIQVGEWACIHRATNLFPTEYLLIKHLAPSLAKYSNGMLVKQRDYPDLLGPDLGKLLGLLVGDGSWTSDCQIQLTCHLYDLPWYKEAIIKAGLEEPREAKDSRSQFGARLSIGCKVLRSYFDSLGFTIDSLVTTKKVPWSIRRSPKDVQAAFLLGLFAADGSCEKGGREVTLSTASKQLAEELQLMLLNFGVVSRVKTKEVKGKDYYVLILRGQRSVKKFAAEIGFGLPRKQQPLTDYLATSGRDGGDTERIPNQKVWLKRLRDSLPSNRGKQPGSAHGAGKLLGSDYADQPKTPNLKLEFRALVGNAIKDNSTEEFSAYRLPALVEFAELHCSDLEAVEHFKHLLECDYFYDPVVSVLDSTAFCVDLSVPGFEQYVSQGFTNHNTMIGSVIVAYEFYKLVLLPSPQLHYKIAASTPIAIFCMATGAEQTKRTIYGQARALLYYVPVIRRLIDRGEIIVGEEQIKYQGKLLYIYAGNSKSSSQVGSSVLLLVMDEVARFRADNGESNALELWSNIGVSGVTFGSDALRVAISSAWEEGDAIEKLYKMCKDPEVVDSMVGFRLRSWDLNPERAARESPVIRGEYAQDPIQAALEFEGVRHSGQYSFLDKDEVIRAFRGSSKIKVVRDTAAGDGLVRMQATVTESNGVSTYLHLDPAVKRDAYGLAFGHKESSADGEPLVVIDGLVAWEPEPGVQVSITNVQSVIYEINRMRPLTKVTSDHAHSPETIQRLKANGINAESIFFSRAIQLDMYDCLRKLLHENRIVFPRLSEYTALLKDELVHLQLINGNKIDHKPDKCLVGETRIPLLDGTHRKISELVGKEVWVYSCKPDGTLVPGRAKGRKTMEVTELLDVGLDNGFVIRCTPDHPFMLRTGNYVAAQDLEPDKTELMCSGKLVKLVFVIPVLLSKPVAVYDLSVDLWDNFAVTAGVIVHNSKDLADCVAAICWQLIGNTHSDWAGSRKLAVVKGVVPTVFSPAAEDEFSNTRSGFKKELLGTRQRWGGFNSLNGGSRFSSDSW